MRIFITGASGSLGTELLKKFHMATGHSLFGLTRNENHIAKLSLRCTPILGDIRNREQMIRVTKGMDLVYHLAALKHVDLMENYISECIKTNLDGTMNLLAAQDANGISKVVFVSTDKAVAPINVYGMCKAISERAVLQKPHNVVCRYGNVLGSTGSVFQKLPEMLDKHGALTITHEDMSRFWITINGAAHFVFDAQYLRGLQIPNMKGANVLRMMRLAAKKLQIHDPKIETLGLRPREKIHETIDEGVFSNTCDQFTDSELEEILG